MKNFIFLKPFLASCIAAIMLCSCATTAKYSSSKTIDIQASVIQKPTVADLDVKETKTTGTAASKNTIISAEILKNEAVSNALKTTNADILVEPRFETIVKGSLTTVTVSGFPATYKNFRPMKIDDIPLMQSGIVRQVSTFVPPTVSAAPTDNNKAKKVGNIILGSTLLLLGLTYLVIK